jgi:ribosomal protein S18 acetylase RimI-like enzyme
MREAAYGHLHADWRYPSDWLGSPGFVVLEQSGDSRVMTITRRLFSGDLELPACLAVAADPPPGAWVRVAAFLSAPEPVPVLAAMLSATVPYLAQQGVTELAWLIVEDWPAEWFTALGFRKANMVETLVSEDLLVDHTPFPPGLVLRAAEPADLPALVAIEAAAFEPIWRHSLEGLTLAKGYAFRFDVAEVDDRLIGFQFSTRNARGGHVARMTVHPSAQGQGVGSALLANALQAFRQEGVRTVSLNTQADNLASKRLYTRFGFRLSGDRFPVWTIDCC